MANHLSQETSPYLLQHAENPVDWYPWGPEALQRAREEDKPIFLSIGYSACHWCHVMAHETFEDPAIAALLNEHFINIKVDREERPDLDSIYMTAVVGMTGQGGWPMSVFLTPDGTPFYGGTYFPPAARYGMPAFSDVLQGIHRTWQGDRAEIGRVTDNIKKYLHESSSGLSNSPLSLTPETLELAGENLLKEYDWNFGGWGKAPKFPAPMSIEFLILRGLNGGPDSLKAAGHALSAMKRGGIYDVVGGGFHRYSTDQHWLVPHFEKMLYDNAQLALAYLHGYLVAPGNTGEYKNPGFRQTCEETLDFVLSEMCSPSGGFYSSLDADSEGEEGKFYVWTRQEIQDILTDPAQRELFFTVYRFHDAPNFEGKYILQRSHDAETLAARLGITSKALRASLQECHLKLKNARTQRVRPFTDDKIIVSWNALILRAFAESARYLARPDYLTAAQKNADFLLAELHPADRLLRSWHNGTARYNAYLEDYGSLIIALLTLYQTDHNLCWYTAAAQLTEEMILNYYHPEKGFYDTRHDHDKLIIRPQDLQDNATPSGSALAAHALLMMTSFNDTQKWRTIAERALAALQNMATRYPSGFAYWLLGMNFALLPTRQVALLWPPSAAGAGDFIETLWQKYRPHTMLAASQFPPPRQAPALLHDKPLTSQEVTAYVCEGFVCKNPTSSLHEFKLQLADLPARTRSTPD